MDDGNVRLLPGESGVFRFEERAEEFRQLCCDFDAGVVAACDHEMQQAPSLYRIGFGLGELQHREEMIPHPDAVEIILQPQRVFADAAVAGEIVDRAKIHDEMIVTQRERCAVQRPVQEHFLLRHIDAFNPRTDETARCKKPARRRDDLPGLNLAGEHLRHEAVKRVIVVLVDDDQFDVSAPHCAAQLAHQPDRDITSAKDKDASGSRGRFHAVTTPAAGVAGSGNGLRLRWSASTAARTSGWRRSIV